MLEGKKIKLRAIEEKDLELLQQWHNDPIMADMVVGWSFPVSMAGQDKWLRASLEDERNVRLVVESKEEGVIGLTGLWDIDRHNRHALTALKIGPRNLKGRGYGTDAILTMMSYAYYYIGLNRLWGLILPYNIPSYKAYVKKCGWKVEGRFRQHIFRRGRLYDLLYVAALREDFRKWPAAQDYIPPTLRGEEEKHIDTEDTDWGIT